MCLRRIPAQRVQKGSKIFLRKNCSDHGPFESIIWRGLSDINEWVNGSDISIPVEPHCPDNCGLCEDHLRNTCCVLINVTDNCNLNCRFCLADQDGNSPEPAFEEIHKSILELIIKDKTLLQLSGGEPTTRKDLPEIISAAKEASAKYVQLNSNGIRLGEDKSYAGKLARAGLSFVFMQFDGTDDSVYESLRGRALLKIKQKAIENCAEHNIGVTLVPTIVRDVNTKSIGEILKYAISQSPAVRGVHFQPVSYFGRIPEKPGESDRITLDELVYEIEKQTDGIIKSADLLPSSCDHPLCGFHGDFVVDGNSLLPLLKRSEKKANCCCGDTTAAEKNREFVARRWLRPAMQPDQREKFNGDIHDMDYFLKQVKTYGFTVTAMAFQDAWNIDFSRLRHCSFHVYDKGRYVPFCAYYLTGWKG